MEIHLLKDWERLTIHPRKVWHNLGIDPRKTMWIRILLTSLVQKCSYMLMKYFQLKQNDSRSISIINCNFWPNSTEFFLLVLMEPLLRNWIFCLLKSAPILFHMWSAVGFDDELCIFISPTRCCTFLGPFKG